MGKVAVAAAVVCAAAVSAGAVLVVRHRMRSSGKWAKAMDILRDFEDKCGTPIAKLRQVADAMTVEMHAGLASDGGSKLKMLISYVDNLPTGIGFGVSLGATVRLLGSSCENNTQGKDASGLSWPDIPHNPNKL